MGKGGGGGQQPTQNTTTSYTASLQPELMPYAQDIAQKSQTLTAANYTPYQGQRIADFTPMQQQAFQDVSNMQVSPQVAQGSSLTGAGGLSSLSAGANYASQATNPYATAAYMSPYMQNVVDYQKEQAMRDYARQLPGMGAAASRAGAFGGSRQAIVEAEGQRNLQNQLAGIQAQGTQAAYDQAMRNQQFGAQLGLQGASQAASAGAQLGQLGGQNLQQQMAINQAQQQAGGMQQALAQQNLSQSYQDFLKQQEYPYSQLSFYNAMIRGLSPVMPTTTQTYTSPPNYLAQLGGLGLGAYSLGKLFNN